MKKIIFTKKISEYTYSLKGKTICIYASKYKEDLPKINGTYYQFEVIRDNYKNTDFFKCVDNCVFVGLNKIFTTSSRIHPVMDLLQYSIGYINRYSIDYSPIIGSIFNIWAHFNFTGMEYFGYNYSYLIETHYNKYIEGLDKLNPLSFEYIKAAANKNTYIDYTNFWNPIKYTTFPVTNKINVEYAKKRKDCFTNFVNGNLIVKELSKFVRENVKERKIPTIDGLYHNNIKNNSELSIESSNLKVDVYLVSKIKEKIELIEKYTTMFNEVQK